MKIEHIAVWSRNIEELKDFYTLYFGASSCEKYSNAAKGFESYFLSFDQGSRLEIMQQADIPENRNNPIDQYTGFIHMALSVGSEEKVREITERLRADGYPVVGEPRRTGDGYYESCILDPQNNRVEITA